MKRVLIIGAGDLGQQIAHWIKSDNQYDVIGFVDDTIEAGTLINELPILGNIKKVDSLYTLNQFDELLIGVGYNHFDFREELYNRFCDKIPFATYIHSTSYVDVTAKISPGCIVYPNCFIDQLVHIKENVLINISTTLGHGCVIGPHSFIAAKVLIGGETIIGKKCMVGNGVTTVGHLKVCDNSTIGCGAVLLKNVIKPGVYLGNPAKLFSTII